MVDITLWAVERLVAAGMVVWAETYMLSHLERTKLAEVVAPVLPQIQMIQPVGDHLMVSPVEQVHQVVAPEVVLVAGTVPQRLVEQL
jgi:hypothetical protein